MEMNDGKYVEVKKVKINLKELIEDLLMAFTSNNVEEIIELREEFGNFIDNQTPELRYKVFDFIFKNKQVQNNECLRDYFLKEKLK